MNKEEKTEIKIQALNLKTIKVGVEGTTPLLMDRMPDQARKDIVDKQTGVSKGNKKKLRDLDEEIKNAIHKTSSGNIGFPAAGFKRGMMESTSFVGDKFFSKKLVSGSIRIINGEADLIPITFSKQEIVEHVVKGQTKFTPSFKDWKAELVVQYDANNISAQDIVTLINYAGFYIGVGSWRPKGRDGGSGEFGTYKVMTSGSAC